MSNYTNDNDIVFLKFIIFLKIVFLLFRKLHIVMCLTYKTLLVKWHHLFLFEALVYQLGEGNTHTLRAKSIGGKQGWQPT